MFPSIVAFFPSDCLCTCDFILLSMCAVTILIDHHALKDVVSIILVFMIRNRFLLIKSSHRKPVHEVRKIVGKNVVSLKVPSAADV